MDYLDCLFFEVGCRRSTADGHMGGDGRRRRLAALAVAAVAVAALVTGNHGYVAHRRTKNHQKSGARTDGSDGNSNGDGGGDADNGAINVCELERKTHINLFCNCDESNERLATSANCWVFNDGEPRDSPVWREFRSQPNIAKLTFNVRGQTSRTLPFVPTDALAQLPALRTLEIIYADIGTVHTHAFANLSRLQDLALGRNGIVRLARESVAHMPDLRVATLGDNAIDGISNDVFAGLPSLRKLYMDRNNISYVAEGAFESLRRLEELDVSHNRLTGPLSRYVFLGLVSLKRLDMRANRLDRIGPDTFGELVGLEELALDDNALRVVDGRGFAGLPDLQRLTVAGNRLTALHDRTFGHRFDKLRYVDVRRNRLRALPYAAVEPLVDRLLNSSSFYLYLQGGYRTARSPPLKPRYHKQRFGTFSSRSSESEFGAVPIVVPEPNFSYYLFRLERNFCTVLVPVLFWNGTFTCYSFH